jgi:cell division transport system permease protein
MKFRRREKTLGIAPDKRRYDLPLNRSAGTGFLILLIGLMTFLAVMALATSFALSAMTARWSSGLEDKVTVEIPAADEKGQAFKPEDIKAEARRIAELLQQHPAVKDVHILSDQEISDLVRPWLGDNLKLTNIPVPGLIALRMKNADKDTYTVLAGRIAAIDSRARLDTHEEWLKDVLRFTGALQFAAALLTLVIGVTAVAAVAGGVRARLAVNRDEVEILHLMGAADSYISRQFQRHSMALALRGSVAGMVVGLAALLAIGWMSGRMEVNLIPGFTLQGWQIGALIMLPLTMGALAAVTARFTVNRALTKLP